MEEIELRAEATLAELPDYIWSGDRPPIPIGEIADSHFGLHVRRVSPAEMRNAPGCPELGGDEVLSGLLLPSLGEIWVNSEEAGRWPVRERFTIAHELGHHVLHSTGQQTLFCRKPSIDPEDQPATPPEPLPVIEREANTFAAALLMPAEMIERYYRSTGRDFRKLCDVFESSGAAMSRRLRAVI
jgi:IrrE N-terminal-like domain